MVSYYSTTEGNGSASIMDESEKIFCTQPKSTPSRQPPSSSPSQSQFQSLSDSCEHISTLPRNKTRTTKTPTTPSKPATSSAKRPRNEDDEPTNKKPKSTKEDPKKINEEKGKVIKPEPVPSPQKSAKKSWDPEEEVFFLEALAAYCQDGKEFPRNTLTPVFDFVRNSSMLDHKYSNSQLGKKMRRLQNKFVGIEDKVKGGDHSFKTSHEERLYKLSKKIWGKEEEEEESEEENEKTDDDGEMTEKESDEDEEEYEEVQTDVEVMKPLATPNVVCNGTIGNGVSIISNGVSNGTIGNGVSIISNGVSNGTISNGVLKENSVRMKEFKDLFKTSNIIGFSSEEMLRKFSSAWKLPALDVSVARMLEQKWKRQRLLELEVCGGRLALLQEECQIRKEKLLSFVDEGRH